MFEDVAFCLYRNPILSFNDDEITFFKASFEE